ncbi:MAG: cupin domain-containing protein [Saprospiraceae bacterium]|nr:cupin domain-containing protein [Saprospiraceae bacterium]
MTQKINLIEKFNLISEYWSPRIITELNGQQIRLAKVKGELIWHSHEREDEMFYVLKGKIKLLLEDQEVIINEGEVFVVPRGVKHKPIAEEECWVVLFEPAETKHTGDQFCEQTITNFNWI